jgi:hypothetical protein
MRERELAQVCPTLPANLDAPLTLHSWWLGAGKEKTTLITARRVKMKGALLLVSLLSPHQPL